MYSQRISVFQIVLTLSAMMIFIGSVEPSENSTKQYVSELLERMFLERNKRIKKSIDDQDDFDMFTGLDDSDFSAFPNYDPSMMQDNFNELNHFRSIPITWLPLGWKVANKVLHTPKQIYTSGKDYFDFGINVIKDMMDTTGVGTKNPQDSKTPPVTVITVTFPVVPSDLGRSTPMPSPAKTFQWSPLDSSIYPLNPTPFPLGPMSPDAPKPVPVERIPPSSNAPTPLSFDLMSSPSVSKSPIPVPDRKNRPILTAADPSPFGASATIASNSIPISPVKSSPAPTQTSLSTPALPDMVSPGPVTYSPVLFPLAPFSTVPVDSTATTAATLSPTLMNTASPNPPLPIHTPFPRASLTSGTPSPILSNGDSPGISSPHLLSSSPLASATSSSEVPLNPALPTPDTHPRVLSSAISPISHTSSQSPSDSMIPETSPSVLLHSNPLTSTVPSSDALLNPNPPTTTYTSLQTTSHKPILSDPESLSSVVPSLEMPIDPAPPTPARSSATLLNTAPPTHASFPTASFTPDITSPILLTSNPSTSAASFPEVSLNTAPSNPTAHVPVLLNKVLPISPPPTHDSDSSSPMIPVTPSPISSDPNSETFVTSSPGTLESDIPKLTASETQSPPFVSMTPDSPSLILSDPTPVTPTVSLPAELESATSTPSAPGPMYSSSKTVNSDSSVPIIADFDPLTPTVSPVPSEAILPPTSAPPLSSEPSTIPVIPYPISLNPATPSADDLNSHPSSPVRSTPESDSDTAGPQVDAPPVTDRIINEMPDDKINGIVEHLASEDEVAPPLTLEELIFHRKEHLKSKRRQLRSDVPTQMAQYLPRYCVTDDETCNSPVLVSNSHENFT